MPWNESREITIPEFPGLTFTWTADKVTDGKRDLITGMPVWNVFLADLTNDGKPEICATVRRIISMTVKFLPSRPTVAAINSAVTAIKALTSKRIDI